MGLPYFSFYPSDFFMKTMNLTDEQVGRYMRLLCNQWINGPLKEVPRDLEQYFVKTRGGWVNERLEEERVKAEKKHAQRVEAARISADKRAGKRTQQRPPQQSESESELKLDTETEASKTRDQSLAKHVNRIVAYLNKVSGKQFRASSRITKEKIQARLNEGFKVEDFKVVIDNKVRDWKGDPEMDKFLRPETLFSNKFESYFNEKEIAVSSSGIKFPDRWSTDFVQKHCQDPKVYMEYERHLKGLGLEKRSGPGGTMFVKPTQ